MGWFEDTVSSLDPRTVVKNAVNNNKNIKLPGGVATLNDFLGNNQYAPSTVLHETFQGDALKYSYGGLLTDKGPNINAPNEAVQHVDEHQTYTHVVGDNSGAGAGSQHLYLTDSQFSNGIKNLTGAVAVTGAVALGGVALGGWGAAGAAGGAGEVGAGVGAGEVGADVASSDLIAAGGDTVAASSGDTVVVGDTTYFDATAGADQTAADAAANEVGFEPAGSAGKGIWSTIGSRADTLLGGVAAGEINSLLHRSSPNSPSGTVIPKSGSTSINVGGSPVPATGDGLSSLLGSLFGAQQNSGAKITSNTAVILGVCAVGFLMLRKAKVL